MRAYGAMDQADQQRANHLHSNVLICNWEIVFSIYVVNYYDTALHCTRLELMSTSKEMTHETRPLRANIIVGCKLAKC